MPVPVVPLPYTTTTTTKKNDAPLPSEISNEMPLYFLVNDLNSFLSYQKKT